MILQGSNLPLVIGLEESALGAQELHIALYNASGEIKHWGKDDIEMSDDGMCLICPLKQSETVAFPTGRLHCSIKWVGSGGETHIMRQISVSVAAYSDKHILGDDNAMTSADIFYTGSLAEPKGILSTGSIQSAVVIKAGLVTDSQATTIVNNWLASHVNEIKGDPGEPGSDANVTSSNIQSALGYSPANAVHTHSVSDVNGLQSALNSKVDANDSRLTDSRNPIAHGHTIDDVNNLQNILNSKQDYIQDLDDIVTGASLGATALQSFTETDPTVPAWAKSANKPEYTAVEVGAAAEEHSHVVADINGLQEIINNSINTIPDIEDIRAGAALGSTALQSYSETDPTVPAWAKSETKPTYTASEVGAAGAIHGHDIGDINGLQNALDNKQDKISDINTIRSGSALGATALQSFTETDPTVPSWAKQPSKPSYTASEVGALPSSTFIPTKMSDLTQDIETGKIDSISVNGVAQTITNKNVNVSVPVNVSELANDSGYITQHQDISGKADKDELERVVYYEDTEDTDTEDAVTYDEFNEKVEELGSDISSLEEDVGDIKQDLSALESGKLSAPESGLAVGKYFRVASIDADGKAVLEACDLPIASNSTAGVIKLSTMYGSYISGTGIIYCPPLSLSTYSARDTNLFIGKGTLENIKTDLVGRALADDTASAYTATQQASARARLGAVGGEMALVASETTGEDKDYVEILNFESSACLIIVQCPVGSANTQLNVHIKDGVNGSGILMYAGNGIRTTSATGSSFLAYRHFGVWRTEIKAPASTWGTLNGLSGSFRPDVVISKIGYVKIYASTSGVKIPSGTEIKVYAV